MVVGEFTQDADVLVIGGGPAGRAAARRCCELGRQTMLVDPSPCDDIADVECLEGTARFVDKRSVQITGEHVSRIRFKRAIICTGCRMGPDTLLGLESSGSWRAPSSGRVLVAGTGPVAIETAMKNVAAGGDVVLACPGTSLLPTVDPILAAVIVEHLASNQVDLLTNVQFADITQDNDAALVVLDDGTVLGEFEQIVAAQPFAGQIDTLDLHSTSIELDENNWIKTTDTGATAETRILAAGGVTGRFLEAAAARLHGQLVAETACGLEADWDPVVIPTVLESPLPMSWCGLNESMAMDAGHETASTGLGHGTELIRMVHDPGTGLLLGAGATGPAARSVGEAAVIAIEMGATMEDLAAMSPISSDHFSLSDVARTAWKASR